MLELTSTRADLRVREEGAWVTPDPTDLPGLEVKTRALGRTYFDAVALEERRERRRRGLVATAALPADAQLHINVGCLITHCLQDVRGVTLRGEPVTFTAFCDLIRQEEYEAIRGACFAAAATVASWRKEDTEEVGNGSASGSPSTSNGANTLSD